MKKPVVQVSDRAVIRYLERVMGLDIEGLRCEIGRKVNKGAGMGAAAVIIDGFRYRLADNTVTTVVSHNSKQHGFGNGKGGDN